MDTLPSEIIDQIVKNLDQKSLFTCLTLNKKCYFIFLMHLYKEIHFSNNKEKLTIFIYCLHHYPRTKKAGEYVQILSTDHSIEFNQLNPDIDSLDTLMHFPNIKELTMKPSNKLVRALADTRRPVLTKIKLFKFECSYSINKKALSHCLYRYRSSLTNISITSDFSIPLNPIIDVKSYIASFPCLVNLSINVKESEMGNTFILTDIFKAFPLITNLYYRCLTMNLNPFDPLKVQTFLNVRKLEIDTSYIAPDDACHIKNSFPQLKELKLILQESQKKTEDEYKVIDILTQMKVLGKIHIRSRIALNMNTVINFMNQLNERSKDENESVYNKVEFYRSWYNHSDTLITEYHPYRRLGSRSIYMKLRLEQPRAHHILDQIGGNLNTLEIHTSADDFEWRLEDINQRCPRISELILGYIELIASVKIPITNNHLTKLTLDQCYLNRFTFAEIVSSYPFLQELHLLSNYLNSSEDGNVIKYVELPIKSLRLMRLKTASFSEERCNLMVIKVVNDVWVKSWTYNTISKAVTISEDSLTIFNIKPLKENPLTVFNCSSIQDVIFDS
ncbi:hypothetical protein BDB01DRAFT_808804 [Pilobolus umbonatus]|nr:hypothetical protein BDB01DRAFT_808804 [Pilobolus umbonatus]